MHAILQHCYFKVTLFHYKTLLVHNSSIEGLRGGACSLVPYKNLQLLPCSPKIKEGVPRNLLLLSSCVPRNSAPSSLDRQKYSSLSLTISLIFRFSWLVIIIGFTSCHSTDTPWQNASFSSLMTLTVVVLARVHYLRDKPRWCLPLSSPVFP